MRGLFAEHLEFDGLRHRLVVLVQWITAGDHAVPRRGGAVTESSTKKLLLKRAARDDVCGERGVGKHRSTEANHVDHVETDFMLGDRGKPFLKV